MSALGQKRTSHYLFDHLVRTSLHRRRHVDAKGLGRLKIDDQFKLGCLQDWQFGRIFTLENSASIKAGRPIALRYVRSVAHQTAGHRKITILIDRGHSMANCQGGKLVKAAKKDRACSDYEPAHS